MLRMYCLNRKTDFPVPSNRKKKIENQNPYITYLENLNVLSMSCSILPCIWFFGRLHILLNPYVKNAIEIKFPFGGMFIVIVFVLFRLKSYLRCCRDKRSDITDFEEVVNWNMEDIQNWSMELDLEFCLSLQKQYFIGMS